MGATLLIVDDSQASRDALAILLGEEGYDTIAAADAARAEEALRARAVDLVLLDVTMPGTSGLELLDRLRRDRTPMELPVIMVTGKSESQAVVEALSRGANDYITKPVDLAVLLARVRTQLEMCRLARLKDEFLRIASHDLKNPLTAILGAADALAEDFPVGATMTDQGRWYINDAIKQRALRIRRIIADFLDLGALQEGRLALSLAPVELKRLAEQSVAENLAYARSKSISLGLTDGAPVPAVRADGARIAQVLDNLVGNAIKFCPTGGVVKVTVAEHEHGAAVEVRDTGPGLSNADLGRLFTRYARLANRPTGGEASTGLGLAMCRQLVELHGGRIAARNAEGGGALFWFELPRL